MVIDAVTSLAEINGSSFQTVSKFIADKYKVDTSFIRSAITKLVETGKLIETKGSGLLKIPVAAKKKVKSPKSTSTGKKQPVSDEKDDEDAKKNSVPPRFRFTRTKSNPGMLIEYDQERREPASD
ncbi:Histone H1-gamma, late [Folsomia candida]|uniref:Histone H1-gamma, late n=1 Tax=Folsomia candida TaxID=158441 RepID=A0A226DS89_FOLCA|nr:Histone H1-gamma, late [Folsomia candida]